LQVVDSKCSLQRGQQTQGRCAIDLVEPFQQFGGDF
jgi:hypothetical protein